MFYYADDEEPTGITSSGLRLKHYQCPRKDAYAFPRPIMPASKLEFSMLPASPYDPGTYGASVSEKSSPSGSSTPLPPFQRLLTRLSLKIAVDYDAYELAYEYYLDDLRQDPDQPLTTQDVRSVPSEILISGARRPRWHQFDSIPRSSWKWSKIRDTFRLLTQAQ